MNILVTGASKGIGNAIAHELQDIGEVLNKESLFRLIEENKGISCVGLMGGDQAPNTINWLAKCIKEQYPELKVGWYSGRNTLP